MTEPHSAFSSPIRTARLTLRPAKLSDAARLAEITSDFEIAKNVASIPHPHPVAAVEGFLLLNEARAPLGRDHVRVIETEADGVIGCVGLHQRAEEWELGYYVGRQFWGRGLATEAARALLEGVIGLGYRRFGSTHFVDNPASGRVLEKLGFHYTGETRPRFSMARASKALARVMRMERA